MTSLVLTTPSDPGQAAWLNASLVDASLLLLVVPLAVAGAGPSIDPTGRRNIIYECNFAAGQATLELPEITPVLPPIWRVTIGGADTSNSLLITPAAGNTILNQTDPVTVVFRLVAAATYRAESITFVHDGATGWAVFYGELTEYTPPAADTNEFRSFGKRLFAGETPIVFDPNGLASGAYSVDAAGSVTVPLAAGITAGLPSTGYALVLPATSSLGRALAAGPFSWAVLRAFLEARAGTTGTMRFGIAVMNTSDPTTAQGWGAAIQANPGGTLFYGVALVANTAGAWAGTVASVSVAVTSGAEGASIQNRSGTRTFTVARILSTGIPASASSGSAVGGSPGNISFAAGTWVCMWWGASDALVTAGSYTGRAATSLNDSIYSDTVGV